jgi:hypothetical protein
MSSDPLDKLHLNSLEKRSLPSSDVDPGADANADEVIDPPQSTMNCPPSGTKPLKRIVPVATLTGWWLPTVPLEVAPA